MRILFFDAENFKHKALEATNELSQAQLNWNSFNFSGLFQKVMKGVDFDEKRFYYARLRIHPDTEEKSKKLIEDQRTLLLNIRNHDFIPILSGNVRGRYEKDIKGGEETLVFREKGVDVKIAVDMVLGAWDGLIKEIYLCSSDSDLQPAIKAVRKKGIKIVYVGFQMNPNIGMQKTTNETFLIRSSEIIEFSNNLFRDNS